VWDEFSGMKITSISLWSTVEVETYQGSFSSEGFCHRTLLNCFFNSSVSWLFSAVSNSLIVEHRAVSIYIEIFFFDLYWSKVRILAVLIGVLMAQSW